MRKLLRLAFVLLVLVLAWFGVWYFIMAPHVARVEASLKHHFDQFRAAHPHVELKWTSVYPTGFPFGFQVGVEGAELSMIDGAETFAVNLPRVTLSSAGDGLYRVRLPAEAAAFYAKDGQAPEHYSVSANPMPQLMLSARAAKAGCGPMTGKACEALAEDAPLISYAAGVAKSIALTMTLGTETRTETIPLAPIDITVPIYQEIPNDLSYPLEIFVRMLREGLVYKTPTETP